MIRQWSTLGQKLRSLRKSSHMTLKQLAHEVGLSLSYLSDIERDRTSPSLNTLALLAELYDMKVSNILEGLDL